MILSCEENFWSDCFHREHRGLYVLKVVVLVIYPFLHKNPLSTVYVQYDCIVYEYSTMYTVCCKYLGFLEFYIYTDGSFSLCSITVTDAAFRNKTSRNKLLYEFAQLLYEYRLKRVV